MSKEELIFYNTAQIKEMETHRWIESEKVGYDLGEEFYLDWIVRHSQRFREEWVHENALDITPNDI